MKRDVLEKVKKVFSNSVFTKDDYLKVEHRGKNYIYKRVRNQLGTVSAQFIAEEALRSICFEIIKEDN